MTIEDFFLFLAFAWIGAVITLVVLLVWVGRTHHSVGKELDEERGMDRRRNP